MHQFVRMQEEGFWDDSGGILAAHCSGVKNIKEANRFHFCYLFMKITK